MSDLFGKQEFVGHFWHEELCEISTFCFSFSFFFVLFFVVVISIIICFWILFCILICFCILIFICIFEVNELGTQEDSCSGSSGLCIHSELKKFSGLNSTYQPLWIIIMGGLHMGQIIESLVTDELRVSEAFYLSMA